jgi:hypothetical protein
MKSLVKWLLPDYLLVTEEEMVRERFELLQEIIKAKVEVESLKHAQNNLFEKVSLN